MGLFTVREHVLTERLRIRSRFCASDDWTALRSVDSCVPRNWTTSRLLAVHSICSQSMYE